MSGTVFQNNSNSCCIIKENIDVFCYQLIDPSRNASKNYLQFFLQNTLHISCHQPITYKYHMYIIYFHTLNSLIEKP